jgi:hypothetical protein
MPARNNRKHGFGHTSNTQSHRTQPVVLLFTVGSLWAFRLRPVSYMRGCWHARLERHLRQDFAVLSGLRSLGRPNFDSLCASSAKSGVISRRARNISPAGFRSSSESSLPRFRNLAGFALISRAPPVLNTVVAGEHEKP